MKDEMLDKMKSEVAAKERLDKQIADLKKQLDSEKSSVTTLSKDLKSSKDEVRKVQL